MSVKQEKFKIGGMTCASCSGASERVIKKLGDGVNSATVNLLSEQAVVMYDEDMVSTDDIIKAVQKAGFSCKIYNEQEENELSQKRKDKQLFIQKMKLIIALVFTVPLFYIAMAPMIPFVTLPYPNFLSGAENAVTLLIVQFVLTIPVIAVGYKFYTKGFSNLVRLSPNMDSLVAIGTASAFIYSIYSGIKVLGGDAHAIHSLYFESTAVIITLILLGKYLEENSKGKTAQTIKKLLDLAPKTAIVMRNGEQVQIDIAEVVTGDTVLMKPGASMPVDGIVTKGMTTVDESMLTGESMPVDKNVGDRVFAATINKNGSIEYTAEKVGSDTALSQIIRLVQEASGTKAPIAKLADKVSSVFVPVVIGVAVLATLIWYFVNRDIEFALTIFISVMVIACPCALGLATPTAIIVATGRGASKGILFKNATALQKTREITSAVFDKTGTITVGAPEVTDVVLGSKMDLPAELSATNSYIEDELLALCASAEKQSEHPLGQAIVKYAQKKGITLSDTTEFNSVTGFGIDCVIDGKKVSVGKREFVGLKDCAIADNLANAGKTPLFIKVDNDIVGIIAVADVIRDSSKKAIELLHKRHIKTYMLTGDNHNTATAIAQKAGIDNVFAEVLPSDKTSTITSLQSKGETVLMVGDGINDAPALTTADIGFAIGNGTDIAIESADVVLVRNDIMDVVTAIDLSSATMRNIKQNLFWAFCYNVLGIPVACGVLYAFGGPLLNPMLAAAAMSLSSVSVVANALRLNRAK